MKKSELLVSNEEQITTAVNSLAKFGQSYAGNLEIAEGIDGFSSPGQGERVRRILNYCDLRNPDSVAQRVILSGPAMAVLPPNPTKEEIEIAEELTIVGGQTIGDYQNRFSLKSIPLLPIPTVFVRTNEEMKEFARKDEYAGVISLTYNPLGSTFNLEAAKYTSDHLGQETGGQAFRVSKYHEDAHTTVIRHQLALCREKGIANLYQAATYRAVSIKNSICWELAANEAPITFDVFPYQVAALGTPHPLVDIAKIVETGNIDYPDFEKFMYHPIYPGSSFIAPFVTSPECANVYMALQKMTQIYRERIDSGFFWTKYQSDYLKKYPLADMPLPMPTGFNMRLLAK